MKGLERERKTIHCPTCKHGVIKLVSITDCGDPKQIYKRICQKCKKGIRKVLTDRDFSKAERLMETGSVSKIENKSMEEVLLGSDATKELNLEKNVM
jgi:hypothetical protein|tara:strand:- start:10235 stop:10525 length:291 start_codon:yes stop_codon:yes gene_type:complete